MSLAAVRTLELSKLSYLRQQIRVKVLEKKDVSVSQLLKGVGVDFPYTDSNIHRNSLILDAISEDHTLAIDFAEHLADFLNSFSNNKKNQTKNIGNNKDIICKTFALAAKLPATESLCSALCWWAKYFITQPQSGGQIINCNLAAMSALLQQQERGSFEKCLTIWMDYLSIDNGARDLVFQEILISAWRGTLWLFHVNQQIDVDRKVEYISAAFTLLNHQSQHFGDRRKTFIRTITATLCGALKLQTNEGKIVSADLTQSLVENISCRNSDAEVISAIQDTILNDSEENDGAAHVECIITKVKANDLGRLSYWMDTHKGYKVTKVSIQAQPDLQDPLASNLARNTSYATDKESISKMLEDLTDLKYSSALLCQLSQ